MTSVEIPLPIGVNPKAWEAIEKAKSLGTFDKLPPRTQALLDRYSQTDDSLSDLVIVARVTSNVRVGQIIRSGMSQLWEMTPELQEAYELSDIKSVKRGNYQNFAAHKFLQRRSEGPKVLDNEIRQKIQDEIRAKRAERIQRYVKEPDKNQLRLKRLRQKARSQEFRDSMVQKALRQWNSPEFVKALTERNRFRVIRTGQLSFEKLSQILPTIEYPQSCLDRFKDMAFIQFAQVEFESVQQIRTKKPEELLKRIRRAKKAFDSVILGHQHLVNVIASTYLREDRELGTLVSAVQENLLKAAARYVPLGYSFGRFARSYIIGGIMDEIENESGVGRKTYRKIKKIEEAERYLVKEGIRPTDKDISSLTGFTPEQIYDARIVDSRRRLSLEMMQEKRIEDGSDRQLSLANHVDEFAEWIDDNERKEQLTIIANSASKLPKKCQELLKLRYVEGLQVNQVVDRLGISRTHYFRLHNNALEKIREDCLAA